MKIIHSARKADAQYIHDRLYAYNCSKTGETPKKIVLPDEPAMHSFIIPAEHSDEILGGLVYHVKESACKVDFLGFRDPPRAGRRHKTAGPDQTQSG